VIGAPGAEPPIAAPVSYLQVLRTPQALRVFLPALLGRLSFAMVTLVLLFAVQGSTGSFAVAGLATGAFGLANVLASPYRARLVDRWGQRLTLNSLAAAFALGLVGIAAVTAQPRPSAVMVVLLAAVTGLCSPPLGAAMRVLWGTITRTPAARRRAYSVDAVAEEVLFTTGPLLVALLITATSATVALSVTAAIAVIGTLGLTSSRVSRAVAPALVPAASSSRPLRQPGFRPVLVALLGVGIVLGVVEVTAPAIAVSVGSAGLAGVLMAAFAAGSAVGGLLYGRREWATPLPRRLIVLAGSMAALTGLIAWAPGVVALAIGLAAVGFFLAPSLVTGYLLADDLTAPEVRTEASSWINTAVNTGAAFAAAAAGVAVDAVTASAALAGGAIAAALCLLGAAPFLIGRRAAVPVTPGSGS